MKTRRRSLSAVVLVSIAVNAGLGIYALLSPHFGDLQGKVLATSACVTGAGVLAFACLPAWERGRLALLPPTGVGFSVLGFALVVAGVWSEAESGSFWKTTGTVLVVAGGCVLVSVLSLARLAPRYRWAFSAALFLSGLLGAMIVAALWAEPSSGWYVRLLGVVAVLLAAVTLALPILHRASRGEPEAAAPLPAGIRFCPSCGRRVSPLAGGETACSGCGGRFQVRFLPERARAVTHTSVDRGGAHQRAP